MLPEIIIKTENLEPYKNGWYKGFIIFPKNEKNNSIVFYKEVENQNIICRTGIRHYNNDIIIDNYLEQINKNLQYIQKNKLIIVGLTGIEKFTKLLFIPVHYTIISQYYPDEIHEKLIEIMPLYDNEITGKETPNQMKHIQTKYLSPIDWDRKAIESNILQKEKERKGKMKLEKRMKNIIKKII